MPALPSLQVFDAPAGWQAIDLISDLHLAESTPKTFDAWAAYMLGTSADAVFILGDWVESWVGDDTRHGGFERRCALVLAEAAARRQVGFMVGNRDFLIGDEMLAECGVLGLADPTLLAAFGERYLLTHGDALCLSDEPYQRFRAQVRDPAFIRFFLAKPVEERRAIARSVRDGSEQRKRVEASGQWADVDTEAALRWLESAGSKVMIHGHTHRPGSESIAAGVTRHVLTDWDLDDEKAPRAEVLRIGRDGVSRRSLAQAVG